MPDNSYISKINRLSPQDIQNMYSLHKKYFTNVLYDNFLNDLNEKQWVIILRDINKNIAGFSTIQIINIKINGDDSLFLYNGDTIVAKYFWQSSKLAGYFYHFILKILRENKNINCYWLLTTKGFRTYRFLPVFFNDFYPSYKKPTPRKYKILIDTICEYKFNRRYDPSSFIIKNYDRDFLNPEMSKVEEFRLKNPHVQFFLKSNPEYYKGDELACIADLKLSNINQKLIRVIKQTKVNWYD